jgi:polar amino acid transport system substrate-binding protein
MRLVLAALVLQLSVWIGGPALAQDRPSPRDPLQVAIKEAPPFAMKRTDGKWQGITVTLWTAVAAERGYRYEFIETDLQGMLDGVAGGQFDAGVGALSVTPEREERMDFSHPFYSTGLGIAVNDQTSIFGLLARLPWRDLALIIGGLLGLMLAAGSLIWLLERRANPDQFGGTAGPGIGAGFWWSAVTMTTVGYGDKVPVTTAGRALAIIWMISSVIVIAGFTAAITSALTVNSLSNAIQGPDDLPHRRVGSVPGSASAGYLNSHRIGFVTYTTLDAGLDAVASGNLDAFVYDRPLLLYKASERPDGTVRVLPKTFGRQDYAIALPNRSPIREAINQSLVRYLDSPDWQATLERWLGRD